MIMESTKHQAPSTNAPSDRRRWQNDFARTVADGLIEWLKPYCEVAAPPATGLAGTLAPPIANGFDYICAAGSLRRGKLLVGDVEILYVPKIGSLQKPGEMFESLGNLTDIMIEELLINGKLAVREGKGGTTAWGPLNKLAVHKASGMPVDLFATTKENWFVSLVIRTGPKELNMRLIESAKRRGLQLHAYGAFTHIGTGEPVIPQSEEEVFELCGFPYIQPEGRS
jgi:DNA polymerase/3'-5' exonuclease PolX